MPDRKPKPTTDSALGIAFAGGAVLTCLLDELVNQGVLSEDDIRGVLQRASNSIVPFYDTQIGLDASRAFAVLFARFPEKCSEPGAK
jgi:hypothetical protein